MGRAVSNYLCCIAVGAPCVRLRGLLCDETRKMWALAPSICCGSLRILWKVLHRRSPDPLVLGPTLLNGALPEPPSGIYPKCYSGNLTPWEPAGIIAF